MKYSNEILTESSFDKVLEDLCYKMGFSIDAFNSFVECLDSNFKLQYNNGVEEWINVYGSYSNPKSGYRIAYQRGQLAYEFGNGFVVMDYEVVL